MVHLQDHPSGELDWSHGVTFAAGFLGVNHLQFANGPCKQLVFGILWKFRVASWVLHHADTMGVAGVIPTAGLVLQITHTVC